MKLGLGIKLGFGRVLGEAAPVIEPQVLIEGPDASLQTVGTPIQPAKGSTYVDQDFGTTVRRVSNAEVDLGAGDYLIPEYSRRPAFNSDNTKILLDSTSNKHIVSNTGELLVSPYYLGPDTLNSYKVMEAVWHYSDPDLMFAIAGDPNSGVPGPDAFKMNVLDTSDVTNGVPSRRAIFDLENTTFAAATGHQGKTTIMDVWTSFTPHHMWTRFGEGTPSHVTVSSGINAGFPRYWVLQIHDNAGYPADGLGCIVYDLEIDQIIGLLDYKALGMGAADHVDISNSGQYVVVGWAEGDVCPGGAGDTGTFAAPCGAMIYTNDFSSGFGLFRNGLHSDWAVDDQNRDVYVWIDFDFGPVNYTVAETQEVFQLFEHSFVGDIHVSGKCFNLPGYAIMSSYDTNDRAPQDWYIDKVFAVELTAAYPKIFMIGHTNHRHNGVDDITAPHATVNIHGTRVAWGSNWIHSGLGDKLMDTLVAEIPPGSFPTSGHGFLLGEVEVSAALGVETRYSFEVPEGATSLSVRTTAPYNGGQDADLYVKHGAPPTTSDNDGLSESSGANEEIIIPNPTAGTWHVMINAWTAFTELRIEARYE